jgi:hypothetical protein
MWTDELRQEIVELFIEARHAGKPPRISLWCLRAHASKLERRRRWYSIRKQIQPTWYARMLDRAKRNAKIWRVEHGDRYDYWQQVKSERNAERRATRTRNLVCARCHKEFKDRAGIGPIPKFCSVLCSCRAAGIAYYYRQREKAKQMSGASGKFFVTPHAVQRYRERVHRGITYEQALSEVIAAAATAHAVKEYRGGAQYYRCSRTFGRLRLLVNNKQPGKPQIVTILPAADNMGAR